MLSPETHGSSIGNRRMAKIDNYQKLRLNTDMLTRRSANLVISMLVSKYPWSHL